MTLSLRPGPFRCFSIAALALTLVLGARGASAQAPAAAPPPYLTQYVHDAWQVEDGLPQNTVYAITQTRDGYLWLGTQGGLVRFDGVRFEVFDMANTEALRSNEVRALLEDSKGRLWIGTNGGGLTRMHQGRFLTYSAAEGLPSDHVRALYEDAEGRLWIGMEGGHLASLHEGTFASSSVDLSSADVHLVTEDKQGGLWAGTSIGLVQLAENRHRLYASEDGLPNDMVYAVQQTQDGARWIGTQNGLARYKGGVFESFSTQDGLPHDFVTALHEDRHGTLWIGTFGGGLARYHDGRFQTFAKADGLTDDLVRAFYEDREGSLWIGTNGGGLNRLRASGKFVTWSAAEGLADDSIFPVLETRDGALWIGTQSGLDRLVDGKVTHFGKKDGLASEFVFALYEDRRGRLWVGTYGGGLCRRETERFSCLTVQDGLASDFIFSLHEDHAGTLWIGTLEGLSKLQHGTLSTLSTIPKQPILALEEDVEGHLWIGTHGNGIYHLRHNAAEHFDAKAGLASERIVTLYDDGQALWIGTQEGGLCHMTGEGVRCFGVEDGLPDDNITQIVEDDFGYLWLGTLNGIARVRKADLLAYAAGQREALSVERYGKPDGLKSIETNGGPQPTAWKGRDGRLWFSTVGGLATVDPAHLHLNALPPPVHLERVVVDGETLPAEGEVQVSPGSKNYTFDFTATSLAVPERVRFKIKLEGFDDAWIDLSSEHRSKSYTNLSPGHYTFRVQASNDDGLWNEEGATLRFYVQPFFYQTVWFYLLCAFLFTSVGFGAHRLRVRALRAQERKLRRLVDVQTKELQRRGEALEKLNEELEQKVEEQVAIILDERQHYEEELVEAKEKAEESAHLKSMILTNMSHEIRTPISAIIGSAQILSMELEGGEFHEFIEYIEQNGKRLLETLSSILDLSKLESDEMPLQPEPLDLADAAVEVVQMLEPIARYKSVDLRAELNTEEAPAWVDRAGLRRVLNNLVSNAIKFTDAGEVVVAVERNGQYVRLMVRDTGVGIGEDFLPELFEAFKQESCGLDRSHEGSGLGLAITKRLVEAMGGEITVESTKGAGSTFITTFPLRSPDQVPA